MSAEEFDKNKIHLQMLKMLVVLRLKAVPIDNLPDSHFNAVKNFNEWESKQGEHTYDDWDK